MDSSRKQQVLNLALASVTKQNLEEAYQTHLDRQELDKQIQKIPTQKIVTTKELSGHLNDGWEFSQEFQNGKIIIKAPMAQG